MIRDFVHLIQNKLRHYAVFPSLHSLSRSSAFQTALFLLGVLAFARACIFSRPSVCNNTGVCLCKRHIYAYLPCRNRPEKSRADLQLHLQCTRHAAAFGNSERKKCARHLFRFRRLGKKLSGAALYDSQRRTRYRRSVDNAGISFHPGTDAHTGKSHAAN